MLPQTKQGAPYTHTFTHKDTDTNTNTNTYTYPYNFASRGKKKKSKKHRCSQFNGCGMQQAMNLNLGKVVASWLLASREQLREGGNSCR